MTIEARKIALRAPRDWSTYQAAPPINDDAAESGALRFGTRLGQPSLTVIPVSPADCKSLAERAPELAWRWLRISHTGLMRAIRDSQPPSDWSKCSGLTHHRALMLDANGVFRAGPLTARLDRDLGLVIE